MYVETCPYCDVEEPEMCPLHGEDSNYDYDDDESEEHYHYNKNKEE